FSLQPEDVPNMLSFIRRHWLPECMDLLPSLFGAVINRMWIAFFKREMNHELSIICYRVILKWVCGYLGDLKKSGINESIKTEVLIQILKNGLVDFIGRIMLFLNPTTTEPTSDHGEAFTNMNLLWECEHIFKTICLLPPQGVLNDYFETCGASWWRFYWQPDSLLESPELGPDITPFYQVCAPALVFNEGWSITADTVSTEPIVALGASKKTGRLESLGKFPEAV
ncbi:unnamed protein product, partial [Rhizoctonia solani]